MWVVLAAIAGGVLTVAAAVSSRLLDTWAEGRGARDRRVLVADMDLLKAIPPELRGQAGEKALADRIDRGLATYASDELALGSDSEHEIFTGFLRRVIVALHVILAVILAIPISRSLDRSSGISEPWNGVLGLCLGALTVGAFWLANKLIADLLFRVVRLYARRKSASRH